LGKGPCALPSEAMLAFGHLGCANPLIEEMAQVTAGRAGLFLLSFEHEERSQTPSMQGWQDCTCGQKVDHRPLRCHKDAKR
jgi:hypothetical protein